MDINDLWNQAGGGKVSWYDRSPAEVRAFVERIAELTKEKGVEPNWAATLRYVEETFPDSAPATSYTITDTVRRLVKES